MPRFHAPHVNWNTFLSLLILSKKELDVGGTYSTGAHTGFWQVNFDDLRFSIGSKSLPSSCRCYVHVNTD